MSLYSWGLKPYWKWVTSDRPSAVRACVRPCVRLFLVYAINSTVFIRFFFRLVQCLYINEDSNPIENGLHQTVLPSVRASVRLFLVYAINSTVFIRFFSNLFSLYINEDSNPFENGLHQIVRPSVRTSVRLFLVYAINSTVFIRIFSNLFSVFILMRTRTLLKNGLHQTVRLSVRASVRLFLLYAIKPQFSSDSFQTCSVSLYSWGLIPYWKWVTSDRPSVRACVR